MLEWFGIVLEWCWSGVGVAWNSAGGCYRVLEWCWSSMELECIGIVSEWCWSGLEWFGIVLEGVRVYKDVNV